jgi:hypothetical protein
MATTACRVEMGQTADTIDTNPNALAAMEAASMAAIKTSRGPMHDSVQTANADTDLAAMEAASMAAIITERSQHTAPPR